MHDPYDPSRSVLLIVDVQKDYCESGGVFARAGKDIAPAQQMIPRLAKLLVEARACGVRVCFVQNTIDSDGLVLPPLDRRRRERNVGTFRYVVDGSWGHEIVDELPVQPGDLRIKKWSASAFLGTSLDQTLRAQGVVSVVVTGVVTWGCVMATAQSAGYAGYLPLVVADCVAGANEAKHRAALEMMRDSFGEDLVLDSADLVREWQKRQARAPEVEPAPASAFRLA